jgi:hypothetical protein
MPALPATQIKNTRSLVKIKCVDNKIYLTLACLTLCVDVISGRVFFCEQFLVPRHCRILLKERPALLLISLAKKRPLEFSPRPLEVCFFVYSTEGSLPVAATPK